jgi:hypothetical protein
MSRRVQSRHYLGGIGKAAKMRRYEARQARRYNGGRRSVAPVHIRHAEAATPLVTAFVEGVHLSA